MAKKREYKTVQLDSIQLDLPLTIRHGEHRRIERLTIQMAADDFNAIKETFGATFDELETRANDPLAAAQASEEMSDHEVSAMLLVLCDLTQEDIDDIEQGDFVAIKDQMESLYRASSRMDRDQGKVSSENTITVGSPT
jgi:hypothetical protein